MRATVARWSHLAWSHNFPSDTEQTYLDLYETASHDGNSLPYVCVALNVGNKPIATATLIDNDELPGFENLSPWLAALWVEPDYRHQGIANALVRHIEDVASNLGYKRLFLYTHDQQHWYQRHSWKEIGEGKLMHENVTVMSKFL